MKNKYQKANFILGNANNDYNTKYNLDYYNKSNIRSQDSFQDLKQIGAKLQKSSILPGNEKVIYESETQGKFTKPDLNQYENLKTKINTQEL